ncbi:YfiT family bacillithiol transferase [Cohnella terricola]|uniref:Putative metal-dependent hydrolase FPZ45_21680 n=1 Tax=Cohnella terricola TaxID=1289167 RepID=A0A559J8V2_9BACL|nr:putative metal-dependent hydrolase [Cohnella terricola]TVX96318.1 putative metal-dependent hydrolase [Cohnella terricola]
MDKRYPIGRFDYSGKVSSTQREIWINEIEEFPSKLKEAVNDLSEDQLDLRYRDGGWTIRQVVHHLADSHMNSMIRFKLALTEETPTIKPYDEKQWAELQDSTNADIHLSVMLLEALHSKWVFLLRSMTESDYQKQFYHPAYDKMQSLEYTLGQYVWHGKHHIAHISTAFGGERQHDLDSTS